MKKAIKISFRLLKLFTITLLFLIACSLPIVSNGSPQDVQPSSEDGEESVDIPEKVIAPTSTTILEPGDFCSPLPPPEGNVIHVDPSQAWDLENILATAESGDTLMLEDGIYELHGITLWIDKPGITIRSASGNREAVILDGGYESGEVIVVAASDVTIADISIKRAEYHPIHVVPGESSNTENALIYNVHLIDPGQQAIKINANERRTLFVDYGTIACSHLELTDEGRLHVWEVNDSCYTGGIDAHQAMGWVIRDNFIEGFWCGSDLSEHAIHLWTGSRDTIIERNILFDNARGIGLGMGADGEGRVYEDDFCTDGGYVGHYGGVVRNNVIFVSNSEIFSSEYGFDCGICLEQVCGAKILHNTVVSTTAPFSSIEWRFSNTEVEIYNNLLSHNLRERDGGIAVLSGNLENASLDLFVDPLSLDFQLLPSATAAIDQGVLIEGGFCDEDFLGVIRPVGSAPDIGAFEF